MGILGDELKGRPLIKKGLLAGCPTRMTGEESVDEADLIANKHPKTQTEKTGTNDETTVEPGEFVPREGKRQGHSRSD